MPLLPLIFLQAVGPKSTFETYLYELIIRKSSFKGN